MARFLSPLFNSFQAFNDAGVLITGGARLHTYAANTTTPIDTFDSPIGGSTNSNPMYFDSNGRLPVEIWFNEGDTVKFVLQDQDGVDIPNGTFDNIAGINDVSSSSGNSAEWVLSGLTPSYISGTQFNVTGNQTTLFAVGTRVKYVCSGGTLYATVSAVAFSSSTTVTIIPDAAGLDSGLTTVSTGLLTAVGPAIDAGAVTYKSAISYAAATVGKALQDQQAEIVALQGATFFDTGPVGMVVMWPVATIPTGWLELDGSTFSGVTYPDLQTVLGGTTLPDTRGYFVRGWAHSGGIDPGRGLLSTQGFAQQDALGYIGVDDRIQDGHAAVGAFSASAATQAEAISAGAPNIDTTAEGGDGRACYARFKASDTSGYIVASEVRPVNIAFMFIIKAKNVPA